MVNSNNFEALATRVLQVSNNDRLSKEEKAKILDEVKTDMHWITDIKRVIYDDTNDGNEGTIIYENREGEIVFTHNTDEYGEEARVKLPKEAFE